MKTDAQRAELPDLSALPKHFRIRIDAVRYWFFRVRVSVYGSLVFKRFGLWGFSCDTFDRVGFDDGMTVREYFVEAWCRE